MNNEPHTPERTSSLPSFASTMALVKRLRTNIGYTAMRAHTKTKSILSKEVQLPIPTLQSPFIQSLIGPTSQPRATEPTHKEIIDELGRAVKRSNEVLATATTIFPLELFPDTITLDRTKLTITRRSFFFSSDVMSIRVEDILNVSVSIGPLAGTLTVATRVMSSEDHFQINNLFRRDAIHFKHMLQGYVIALHNNIACNHLSRDELIETLRSLGHDSNS